MTKLVSLVNEIDDLVGLSDENRVKVAAMIKRHVHYEKWSTYMRLSLIVGEDVETRFEKWLHETFTEKMKTHEEWMNKSDEDVLTFDVSRWKPNEST